MKAATVSIREATATDLPSILQLYAENEERTHDLLDLGKARVIWDKFKAYPNYKLYIARLHDTVVGTFALLIMDNLAHGGAKSGIVEDVIVASKFQRREIGKQMMRFAMERCRKAGCYKLALSSNLKRASAHAFYESIGFARHGYSFAIDVSRRQHGCSEALKRYRECACNED
jgi:ribosomal protein S18 acetylase RimI-like enzyme